MERTKFKININYLLCMIFIGFMIMPVAEAENLKVFYDKPAETSTKKWYRRTSIVGNGRIAALVTGGIPRERIALNHEKLWRDIKLQNAENPDVSHFLPQIRKLFFEGKIIEASHLARENLGTQPACRFEIVDGKKVKHAGPDPHQPVGDVLITFPGHDEVDQYRREVDMSTGIAQVTYTYKRIKYTREVFAPSTENIIVIKLSADKPEMITCEIELSRMKDPECKIEPRIDGNRIGFNGEFIEKKSFAVSAIVLSEGGKGNAFIEKTAAKYSIKNANEVIILLSITTDSETKSPEKLCRTQLDNVISKFNLAAMTESHIKEHQHLFNRVEISLGENDRSHIPWDQRVSEFRKDKSDTALLAMQFQYGRYGLMCYSKHPGIMPSPLHALLTVELNPVFGNDYHWDINVQESYWQAEPANLPECHLPLFDYIDNLIPNARDAAKKLFNCRGVFIPLTTGGWGKCLKKSYYWDDWTGAAAWIAQHYWWHYEFTCDEEFLRDRAYPFLKEVALFYEDFLVPDPRKDSPHYGKLVTVPSTSPENSFIGGLQPISLCIGATMDFELIHYVFTRLLEASHTLNMDEDKRNKWQSILDQIPPLQIGKHGQLQEWLEDYEEREPGHRHLSHMFAVYPGDQITLEDTPALAQAARVSVERRIENGAWFCSHISKLWARLEEGDLAEKEIWKMVSSAPMAYSMSLCAGIAEMLLQSHRDRIKLLPALPKSWSTGYVKGLCARGAFEVDIKWKNNRLTSALIHSKLGKKCRIQSRIPLTIKYKEENISSQSIGKNIIEFNTESGKAYTILPR